MLSAERSMINLGFKASGNPAMGTKSNIYALIHPENQTATENSCGGA